MAVPNLLAFEKVGQTNDEDDSSENFDELKIQSDAEVLFPRSGHRVAVDDGHLYVLGGYNPRFWNVQNTEDTFYPLFKELWRFNFATKKWSMMQTEGTMPKELASHTALRYGRNLLCFGGTGVPFGENSSNQLHTCNLDTLRWRHYRCTGQLPQKKYGHSMNMVGRYLYVCGGTSGFVYNLDVHQLDLKTGVWKHLKSENAKYVPDSRYRHEVACFNGRLHLFGGGTANQSYKLDKVPVFDLESYMWEEMTTTPDKVHGYPAPRKCHSCVLHKTDAYICGGFDAVQIMDDIWRISLLTFSWTKLEAKLAVPVYFHSADVTPEGCLYVFGGVSKIDTVRTKCVQRIWLQVPALSELSWDLMCKTLNMENLTNDKQFLLTMGVPLHFVERLS